MTTINDLPDFVLVEILCRLPPNDKLSFQCKCVSKRWLSLLSDPYFAARFQRLQLDESKPVITTLTLWNNCSFKRTITSNNPVFNTIDFSLSFLPCYKHQESRVVLGTHKDLLLCCATKYYQSDYYICNPYTKQWFALPPTPQVHQTLPHVGFVVHELEGQDSSAITYSIIPNAEYKWRVVRILPNLSNPNFLVEIFSSETREWRELDVSCPGRIHYFYHYPDTSSRRRPVAHNGMLYWFCQDDCTFVLDPFTTSGDNIAKCCFIKEPDQLKHDLPDRDYDYEKWLGVCGGRLQMCVVTGWYHDDPNPFRVWELKGEVPEDTIFGGGKFKWIVERISLPCQDIPFSSLNIWWRMLSFYPSNENIICLQLTNEVVVCKLCGGTLEIVLKIADASAFDFPYGQHIYPFVLPGWPTPVPR